MTRALLAHVEKLLAAEVYEHPRSGDHRRRLVLIEGYLIARLLREARR